MASNRAGDALNVAVIPLEEGPGRLSRFQQRRRKKYVLDPHNSLHANPQNA
jgi:hypothetical protein